MRHRAFITLLGLAILVSGCATRNWVRRTVSPVETKVDQVSEQANKQGQPALLEMMTRQERDFSRVSWVGGGH